MREYIITKSTSELDWNQIKRLNIDNHQWLPKTDISAYAQLCYDSLALYVKLTATEKDILARFTSQCDAVWNDSCLEFFFCPIWGDERYFDLESNPNGATFIGFGRNVTEIARLVSLDPSVPIIKTETARFDGGWSVMFTIPFDFIRLLTPGFSANTGTRIRANCYKCGDETKKPHYISWSPIKHDTPSFHRPMDFGCMIFS